MENVRLTHDSGSLQSQKPVSGMLPVQQRRNEIRCRVVHGTYLSVQFPSHALAIYACPIPWDVSHGNPMGMTFPWTSLGLSMGHIYLAQSHPIAIYACPIPSRRTFPMDSHRNDITHLQAWLDGARGKKQLWRPHVGTRGLSEAHVLH